MKKSRVNNNSKNGVSWVRKFGFYMKNFSVFRQVFLFYLLVISLGVLLLSLPVSQNSDVDLEDVFFTVASAFSDTGLVTVSTASTWTYFGQAVIAILILVGGLGLFALRVFIFNVIFKLPMSFSSGEKTSLERGSKNIGLSRNMIKISITIMFIIILVASVVLSFYFYFTEVDASYFYEDPYHDLEVSVRFGIFHAISALNNAGFDIMGSSSIAGYYDHYTLQIIFIILFVIGGIGYPVIYDLHKWIKAKFTGKTHQWTLFTKISVLTYFIITVFAIGIVFAIETTASSVQLANENGVLTEYTTFWENPDYGTYADKSMALVFNTMSTRNAGFSTINMHALTEPTIIFYSILMIIGSSPSSTAGGIRTTTFAILVLALWSKLRNKPDVNVFGKRIGKVNIYNAQVVFTTSIIILILGSMLSVSSFWTFGGDINSPTFIQENGTSYSFTDLFFEVSSAFGTTGLSTGITSDLSLLSKVTLIIIMIIGQLGVSTFLLIGGKKNAPRKNYSYVKEYVQVG